VRQSIHIYKMIFQTSAQMDQYKTLRWPLSSYACFPRL